MRWVLGEEEDEFERRLRRLIGFFVRARAVQGEPLLGISQGSELLAAAAVSFPGRLQPSAGLEVFREAVWEDLGPEARARYETCGLVWKEFEIPEPHIHLNMIGVRTSAQGNGFAGRLLQYVHELSVNSPPSEGVTLTTEDPTVVPFYLKAGYEVIGRARIAPSLETWGFFRKNEPGKI